MGIEPTRSAWKAEVLPLNYICLFNSFVVYHIIGSLSNLKTLLFDLLRIKNTLLF